VAHQVAVEEAGMELEGPCEAHHVGAQRIYGK